MQRHGRDDDHVAAREQVRRRGVAEPVDVVVPRAVLLDVEVGLRDVRLGLVVVVVGDEVLDRVVREELAELVAELRGERLVVRDHERGAPDLLDDPGHRRRLAGAGRAEQRLVPRARREPTHDRLDRLRLVAGRRIVGRRLQLGHERSGYSALGHPRLVDGRNLALRNQRLFEANPTAPRQLIRSISGLDRRQFADEREAVMLAGAVGSMRTRGPIPNPRPPKGKNKSNACSVAIEMSRVGADCAPRT